MIVGKVSTGSRSNIVEMSSDKSEQNYMATGHKSNRIGNKHNSVETHNSALFPPAFDTQNHFAARGPGHESGGNFTFDSKSSHTTGHNKSVP